MLLRNPISDQSSCSDICPHLGARANELELLTVDHSSSVSMAMCIVSHTPLLQLGYWETIDIFNRLQDLLHVICDLLDFAIRNRAIATSHILQDSSISHFEAVYQQLTCVILSN